MLPRIGARRGRELLARFGSAAEFFRKAPFAGLPDRTERRQALKRAELEMKLAETHGVSMHFIGEKAYPRRLLQCPDAPLMLYCQGNGMPDHNRMLAVVGTRRCTAYGTESCRQIIREMQGSGICIVSGLAFGIDVTAHKASLESGIPTIAVLANALPDVHPRPHTRLAQEIREDGLLISETPFGMHTEPGFFPRRNRIIAGMCDAVLIVESASKGGAMITAGLAHSYDRELMAVPGRSMDPCSAGCNSLIKSGQAAMVENASDVLDFMRWPGSSFQPALALPLEGDQAAVLEAVRAAPGIDFESLYQRFSELGDRLHGILLELELDGHLRCMPGNRFRLNQSRGRT